MDCSEQVEMQAAIEAFREQCVEVIGSEEEARAML